MSQLIRCRNTVIWLLLAGATLCSWFMGHAPAALDPRLAAVVILVITFIKVRFVMLDFMEVRGAPRGMRVVAECWFVGICVALITLYLRV